MNSSQSQSFPDLSSSGPDFFEHEIVPSTISHLSWSDASSAPRFPGSATIPHHHTDSLQNSTEDAASEFITKHNPSSESNLASAISEVAKAFFAYLVPIGVLLSLFNNANTVVVLRRRRLVRAMSKTVFDKSWYHALNRDELSYYDSSRVESISKHFWQTFFNSIKEAKTFNETALKSKCSLMLFR